MTAALRLPQFEDPEREATAIWLDDTGVAVVSGAEFEYGAGENVVDGDGIGEAAAAAFLPAVWLFPLVASAPRLFPKCGLTVLPPWSIEADESAIILSRDADDPGGIGPAASNPRSDEVCRAVPGVPEFPVAPELAVLLYELLLGAEKTTSSRLPY